MKAIIDTCVIMDAVQNRTPFAQDAQSIFLEAANERFAGYITTKSVTDIYYLVHCYTHDVGASKTIVGRIGLLFGILDTTESDVRHALASNVSDFEDAVMIETALRESIDCIVTRNLSDYKDALLPVYAPQEFLQKLYEKES